MVGRETDVDVCRHERQMWQQVWLLGGGGELAGVESWRIQCRQ